MITYEQAKQLKAGDKIYTLLDKPKRIVEAKVTCCEDRQSFYKQDRPIIFLAWKVKNGTMDYSTFLMSSEYNPGKEGIFLTENDAIRKLICDYTEKVVFYQNKINELDKRLKENIFGK